MAAQAVFMKSFIIGGLAALLSLFPNLKESALDDMSKPYLGEYECKRAQLGSMDCLKRFNYVRLELKDEENFTLYYQEKGEQKRQVNGRYAYDKERKTLILKGEEGEIFRECTLEEGVFIVSIPIAGKILLLEFEQK